MAAVGNSTEYSTLLGYQMHLPDEIYQICYARKILDNQPHPFNIVQEGRPLKGSIRVILLENDNEPAESMGIIRVEATDELDNQTLEISKYFKNKIFLLNAFINPDRVESLRGDGLSDAELKECTPHETATAVAMLRDIFGEGEVSC